MADVVLVERPRPAVAVVTLNRPDRLNAMTAELVEALHGAHELMLTGRPFDAAEAAAMGLVLGPVPDGELLSRAHAEADLVLANAPWAVEMTKETMWANLEVPGLEAAIAMENRTQVLSVGTGDHVEAAAAFLERRPAAWQVEGGRT